MEKTDRIIVIKLDDEILINFISLAIKTGAILN